MKPLTKAWPRTGKTTPPKTHWTWPETWEKALIIVVAKQAQMVVMLAQMVALLAQRVVMLAQMVALLAQMVVMLA